MKVSARGVALRANVQALALYPISATTVSAVFDADNARALATRLLVLAEAGHDRIEVTTFNRPRRSDLSLPVRVIARRRR